MCNYFQEQTKDSVRQIIFSSLFSPQGNKADDSRMSLLGKLVSMAVAPRPFVDDYCCLVPGSIQTLKQIFRRKPLKKSPKETQAAISTSQMQGSHLPAVTWLQKGPMTLDDSVSKARFLLHFF
ncbi:hypothetical protein H8959_008444 [Pygathrix nigripes]